MKQKLKMQSADMPMIEIIVRKGIDGTELTLKRDNVTLHQQILPHSTDELSSLIEQHTGIRGVNASIDADQNLILGNIDQQLNLSITNSGAIIAKEPINLNTLTLKAKKIAVLDRLKINQDLVVKAKDRFDNFNVIDVGDRLRLYTTSETNGASANNIGDINCKKLTLNGAVQLSNNGNINVKKRFSGTPHTVNNTGSLLARDIKLKLERYQLVSNPAVVNSGQWLVKRDCLTYCKGLTKNTGNWVVGHDLQAHCAVFHNCQIMHSDNDIDIKIASRGCNNISASLTSNHGVTISGSFKQFDNRGDVQSQKQVTIVSDVATPVDHTLFQNTDTTRGVFSNKKTGVVSCSTLGISINQLDNYGQFTAKNIQLHAMGKQKSHNHVGGHIEGDNIHLLTSCDFKDEGTITANKLINGDIGGKYKMKNATMTSGKSTKFRSIDKYVMKNSLSESHGSSALKSCSAVKLKKNSVVSSVEKTTLSAPKIKIKQSHTKANRSVIDGQKFELDEHSTLFSTEDVKLDITDNILCEGKIIAKNDIIAAHYPTIELTPTASMIAGNDLSLSSLDLLNRGTMIAKQSILLKIISKYSQSSGARAKANSCLSILASSINIDGFVSSQHQLLLKATQDLCTKLGSAINTKTAVEFCANYTCIEGEVSADEQVILNAVNSWTLAATGLIDTKDLNAQTRNATLSGHILADTLTIDSQGTITTLLHSLLIAGSQLTLSAQNASNAGTLVSYGKLQAKIGDTLTNIDSGKILAMKTLLCDVGLLLENTGSLHGNDEVILKACSSIKNLSEGVMSAEGEFTLDSGWNIENFGKIHGQEELSLCAASAIGNFQSGNISAKKALDIISQGRIVNAGKTTGETTLSLAAKTAIENKESGSLTATQALTAIGAQLLVNAGTVTSKQDSVSIEVKQACQNLSSGTIKAEKAITVLAGLMIKHAGKLESELIGLQAKQYLETAPSAITDASDKIAYQADVILHNGKTNAKKINAAAEVQINNGEYQATADLSVQGTDTLINNNLIEGKSMDLTGQTIINNKKITADNCSIRGGGTNTKAKTIINNDTITIKEDLIIDSETLFNNNLLEAGTLKLELKELLLNYRQGKIKASKAIQTLRTIKTISNDGQIVAEKLIHLMADTLNSSGDLTCAESMQLHAVDLMISGNVTAAKDALLIAKNDFQYTQAIFKVDGTLELILKDGSQVRQAITNTGGLALSVLAPELNSFHEALQHSINFSVNLEHHNRVIEKTYDNTMSQFDYLKAVSSVDNDTINSAVQILLNCKEIIFGSSLLEAEITTPFGNLLNSYYQFLDTDQKTHHSIGVLSKAINEIAIGNSTDVFNQFRDILKELLTVNQINGTLSVNDQQPLIDFLKANPKLATLYSRHEAVLTQSNEQFKAYIENKPYWHQSTLTMNQPPFSEITQGPEYKTFINDKAHQVRDLLLTMPGHIIVNDVDLNLNGHFEACGAGFTNKENIKADSMSVQATDESINLVTGSKIVDIKEKTILKANKKDIIRQSEFYTGDLEETAPLGTIHQKKGQTVIENTYLSNAKTLKLDEAATMSAKTMLLKFQKVQIGGTENKPLSSIESFIPSQQNRTARTDHLSDDWRRMAGIYAEKLSLSAAEALITGLVITEFDQQLEIEKLHLQKRTHTYDRYYTDVFKKRKMLRKSKKKRRKIIQHSDPLPGAELRSESGKVVRCGNEHVIEGGKINAKAGSYGTTETKTHFLPVRQVTAKKFRGKAGNAFGSSKSDVTLARPTLVPSEVLSSEGSITEHSNGELGLLAAKFIAGWDIDLFGKNSVQQKSKIDTVEFAPKHMSKGLVCGVTTGTTDIAATTELCSLNGSISVKSEGEIQSEATQFMAKHRIDVLGASLVFTPIVLAQRLKSDVSGISGFTYFETKTQSDSETACVNSAIAEDDIVFKATNGNNIQTGTQAKTKKDIAFLADRGKVIIKDQTLNNRIREKTYSVGISFYGSKAIEASIRGDFALAAKSLAENFLPPLASIDSFLKAKNVSEQQKSSIRSVYESYKLYKAYSEAKNLTEFAKGQISPRVALEFGYSKSDSRWTDVALPWLQARQIILSADEDVDVTGLTLGDGVESLYAKAKKDVTFTAAQVSSSYRSRSAGLSVGFKAGAVADVGASWSMAEQKSKKFIENHLKTTQSLFFDAGGKLNLEGIFFETMHAAIQAKEFYATTYQDTSSSKNASASFSTSGEASVGAGSSNKQWATTQAGLRANSTMAMNIKDSAHLDGAAVLLGDDAQTQRIIYADGHTVEMYEHPMPADGDCGFHALAIPREEAAQQLLMNRNDPFVRECVGADFAAAFYGYDLCDSLVTDELVNLRQRWDTVNDHIDATVRQLNAQSGNNIVKSFDQWLATPGLSTTRVENLNALQREIMAVKDCIRDYTQNPENISHFIQTTLIENKEFITYVPDTQDHQGRSIMDAIAKINNLEIYVWVTHANDQSLRLNHHYRPNVVTRTVNLKHTDNLTHFNLLRTEAGFINARELTYKHKYDSDNGKQANIGVGTFVGGDFNSLNKQQTNHATASESIKITTESDISGLNRIENLRQTKTVDNSYSVGIVVPSEILCKKKEKEKSDVKREEPEYLDQDQNKNEKTTESDIASNLETQPNDENSPSNSDEISDSSKLKKDIKDILVADSLKQLTKAGIAVDENTLDKLGHLFINKLTNRESNPEKISNFGRHGEMESSVLPSNSIDLFRMSTLLSAIYSKHQSDYPNQDIHANSEIEQSNQKDDTLRSIFDTGLNLLSPIDRQMPYSRDKKNHFDESVNDFVQAVIDAGKNVFSKIDHYAQIGFNNNKYTNEAQQEAIAGLHDLVNDYPLVVKVPCEIVIEMADQSYERAPESYNDIAKEIIRSSAGIVRDQVGRNMSQKNKLDRKISRDCKPNEVTATPETVQTLQERAFLPKPGAPNSKNHGLAASIESFRKELPTGTSVKVERTKQGNFKISADVKGAVPGTKTESIKLTNNNGQTLFSAKNTYRSDGIMVDTQKAVGKPNEPKATNFLPDRSKK